MFAETFPPDLVLRAVLPSVQSYILARHSLSSGSAERLGLAAHRSSSAGRCQSGGSAVSQ